ncbi:trypsin-like peptidase domain-containing protein [Leisingera sp. XS_AS12]|uniref:trypsin-like peptidase domain-containing protein n=1 Tax=Leisingera sp. XS_AS12 TaxID=3241294 RepID=UPI003514D502
MLAHLKKALLAFSLTLTLSSEAIPSELVPAGQCAIVAASRATLAEANAFIAEYGIEELATIYESANGWLAISIGAVPVQQSGSILTTLKRKELIPNDAYCSTGKRYLRVVQVPDEHFNRSARPSNVEPMGEFDARVLTYDEKRFLQTALALEGYYFGMLDGAWGRGSQGALERYTRDKYDAEPVNVHAAGLIFAVIDEIAEGGWQIRYLDRLGMSVAIPQERAVLVNKNGHQEEWRDPRTGLEYAWDRFDQKSTNAAHQNMIDAHTGFKPPYTVRKPGMAVTSIHSRDRVEYLRSDFINGAWSVVYISAPRHSKNAFNLASASLASGRSRLLQVPEQGVLVEQFDVLLAALERESSNGPAHTESISPDNGHDGPDGTGSAFFVNESGIALTNAHVVNGCSALRIDGKAATLIAQSESFDLAAIKYTELEKTSFLEFAKLPAKLNSDLTIAGYPLHGLLGGLNVSRGAVSSLKGLGGSETTMQITAPVQPGNSGGPAVNNNGSVVGVVVAKLDALLVAQKVGDVPENVGFAVRGEIAQLFLSSNGIKFSRKPSNQALSGESIAELLDKATALVECFR